MTDAELDALVATKVMGWTLYPGVDNPEWLRTDPLPNGDVICIRGPNGDTCGCWLPSTDIAAAWAIVERMAERFSNVAVCHDNGWGATFWNIGDERNSICESADTAPKAICLAALKAVGVNVEPPP